MSKCILAESLRVSALVATWSILSTSGLRAATLHWDGTDSTANADGGAGTWNLSNTNWDSTAFNGADTTWTNSDLAVFGGTAGTVTLGENITAGGIQFNTTGYTITTTGQSLNFGAGNNTILFNGIAAATITGPVGGAGNVILSRTNPATAGTLTLNSSGNGWSGATTVNAGMTLLLGQTSTALSNTSSIAINGGTIRLDRVNDAIAGAQISDTAAITFNSGGSLLLRHNSAISGKTENIGAVTVASGQANFDLGNGTSSGGNSVVLSSLTRSVNTAAVTFANGGYGANQNNMFFKVSGATNTAAGSIIGPWSTYGASSTNQNDYAIYTSGDGTVTGANIAASAENTWASGANVTLSGATTLTANRTLNSLRYTGGAQNLDLDNFNLQTSGILNGGSGNLTLSTAGTGVLTAPGSSGGNLFLTTGSTANNITVGAPINDNGGAVTLIKGGAGTLTLNSTSSNYSGGTVINAGTLATTADSNFGSGGGITVNGTAQWTMGAASPVTYNRSLTVNDGAVLTLSSGNAAKTVTGVLSGNGSIIGANTTGYIFTNTGNTFTGRINSGYQMLFASLGDSSNSINLVGSNSEFQWTGGARTFALRPFTLNATGTGNINNNGSGALTIQQGLAISGTAGNRRLNLGGTNTAVNTFAGNIADGSTNGVSVVGVTKNGAGTWALGGTNTYSGDTILSAAQGRLIFQGSQSLSPNSKLVFSQVSSNVSNVRFLDDGVGTINFNRPIEFGGSNTSQVLSIFVGNNNTANQGSSSGTTTGSTIQVGDITHTSIAADTSTWSINATGADSYRLQIGNLTLNNLVARTGVQSTTTILNPTTASMTVGSITMAAGNMGPANDGAPVLRFDGTAANNRVTGNVTNASDYLTGQALSIQKQGTSDWALNGTGNNFTGSIALNTTTTSAGTLSYASAAGTNAINFNQTTGSATLAYTGASALEMSGLINAAALTTGTITLDASGSAPAATINYSNASSLAAVSTSTGTRNIVLSGSNLGNNLFNGVITNNSGAGGRASLTKNGAGKWVMTNTNTYTGTTVVNDGTLQFARMASLYNNTPGNWTAANINVKSGATLAVNVDSAASNGFDSANLNTLLTNISVASNSSQGLQAGSRLGFDTSTSTGGTFTQGNAIANSTGANGGTIGLTKLGSGTLVLDKTNTYTGTTLVNQGILAVNGSVNSAVTVASGAILQGSGSINSSVTINDGGTLAAGNSIESLLTGDLTLVAAAIFAYETNNDAAATLAGDLTAVNGNLTIANAASILTLTDLGAGSWTVGEKLTLASYSGTWNGGLFSFNSSALADDSTINFSGADWTFNYNDLSAGTNFTGDLTGSSFVTMTVIPEPQAATLCAIGLVVLLLRRRR